MHADPIEQGTWRADLALDYEWRAARTVLAGRRHDGPLVVQKPFYPEGDEVCHSIIVHPPAGIAGGDELRLTASAGVRARALLTTPGAGKWYRSAGPWARQRLVFDVAAAASLEWLPQETIVFDGARADMATEVQLQGDAGFIGWEVLCLGRTASAERFDNGECRTRTRIYRDGRLLWLERGVLAGGEDALNATAVLAGQPIVGTLIAAAPVLTSEALIACRKPVPESGEAAVSLLPGLLVARYLGASSEAAKRYFIALWRVLRPTVVGRAAHEPRIWRT